MPDVQLFDVAGGGPFVHKGIKALGAALVVMIGGDGLTPQSASNPVYVSGGGGGGGGGGTVDGFTNATWNGYAPATAALQTTGNTSLAALGALQTTGNASLAALAALISGGALKVTTTSDSAVAPVATTVAAASLQLSSVACAVSGLDCAPSIDGWLMLFDQTSSTPPANGAVQPKKAFFVSSGGSMREAFKPPLKMVNGALLVFSSTGPFLKTSSTSAFMSGESQ